MSRTVLALLFAAAATAAFAQTAGPTPSQIAAQGQASLNQFQAQVQASQIQHLQQQNAGALSSPDPGVQAQALVRRQQIQQQAAQTSALQQQMLSPGANPADLSARLQENNNQIQQLQPPAVR